MMNLTDYNDFFLFLGGLLTIGGIIYLLFRRSLQNVFIAEQEAERLISEEEISKLEASNQIVTNQIPFSKVSKNIKPQILSRNLGVILLIIIIAGFLFNQFLMWRMGSSGILDKLFSTSINITRK